MTAFIVAVIESLREYLVSGKSIEELALRWDARFQFPRPVNEQYLGSYQALLRLLRDGGKIIGFVVACFANIALSYLIFRNLSAISDFYTSAVLSAFLACFAAMVMLSDTARVMLQYAPVMQRETKGSIKWATRRHLEDKGLYIDLSKPIPRDVVPLVPFGVNGYVGIPVHRLAKHCIVVGPSGCGKTTTVFAHVAREFSRTGGLIALDIGKGEFGEFYTLAARYYSSVYRIDLMNPKYSDYFPLFEGCHRNPELAGRVANLMLTREGNRATAGKDEIWEIAAENLLKCLILIVCELKDKYPHPSPSNILDFLKEVGGGLITEESLRGTASLDSEEEKKAITTMQSFLERHIFYDEIHALWKAMFDPIVRSAPVTYGGILFHLTAKLGIWRDPKVQAVLRAPTEEELFIGRRKITIEKLRRMSYHPEMGDERGRAIFLVVSEGEASRLQTVIQTIMTLMKERLKRTGSDDDDKHVLFALDEAGNVKIGGLSEDFGVGRGRKMIFMLGFQGVSQLAKQYGEADAKTIYENCGTFVIFPGVKDATAEWAEKMLGTATIVSRMIQDAKDDKYDSERLQEEARKLMTADEIRRMPNFTQCIVITEDANPIRAGINRDAKVVDPIRAIPRQICILDEHGSYTPKPEPLDINSLPLGDASIVSACDPSKIRF